MRRLIQTNFAAAGQAYRRPNAPTLGLDLSAFRVLAFQGCDLRVDVVTHQVQDAAQQLVAGMTLGRVSVGRMEGGFRRRHGENQPAATRIHGRKTEDIMKENPIRLGIFAVKEKMSTENHAAKYIPPRQDMFDRFSKRS